MIHSAVFHILYTCGVAITVRYATTLKVITNIVMDRKVGPKITFMYFVAVFSHMANSAKIALWRNITLRVTTLDIMIHYLANIVRHTMSQIISIR